MVLGFIAILFSLFACTSSKVSTTPTGGFQLTMERTPEDFAMQTIIALEQLAETPTPTPTELSNLPKPWTEISTPNAYPNSAIATALKPNSIIYTGPGTIYKMACYVQEGTKLIITGRNMDSTWLSVLLGPKQTCITMTGNIIRVDIKRDPTMQFWIFPSSYTISGDLSEIPGVTPAPTWSYYGGKVMTPTIEIPPEP